MTKPVVLAVASDLHAGSTLAPCPREIALDDGGAYLASKVQQWLWECWWNYWDRVRAIQQDYKAELRVVFNGDLVEGKHHGTTQIVAPGLDAQGAVLEACLGAPLSLNPDRIIVVRGTEAHVGASGEKEEGTAKWLKSKGHAVIGDPVTGAASWWHYRTHIQGKFVDIAHHAPSGRLPRTLGSGAVLEAFNIMDDYVNNYETPPDLAIRAHNHKFYDSADACRTRLIGSGAFQLKTSYAHKVASRSKSDIGGWVVVFDGGEYDVTRVEYKAARGPIDL